ncbi:MAG: hypothetical protein JWR39_87, partial [Devosia sp.]|nr:hypothetical protein [Devosia sp.]
MARPLAARMGYAWRCPLPSFMCSIPP